MDTFFIIERMKAHTRAYPPMVVRLTCAGPIAPLTDATLCCSYLQEVSDKNDSDGFGLCVQARRRTNDRLQLILLTYGSIFHRKIDSKNLILATDLRLCLLEIVVLRRHFNPLFFSHKSQPVSVRRFCYSVVSIFL